MSGCNRCLTGDIVLRACNGCGHVDRFDPRLPANEPTKCTACGTEANPVARWTCTNPGLCAQCEAHIRAAAPTEQLAWLWVGQARGVIRVVVPDIEAAELVARLRAMDAAREVGRMVLIDVDPIEVQRQALEAAVEAGEKANAELVERVALLEAEIEATRASLLARTARVQELLALTVRLTNEVPFPEEIAGWQDQRAKLIAEVGSLGSIVRENYEIYAMVQEAADIALRRGIGDYRDEDTTRLAELATAGDRTRVVVDIASDAFEAGARYADNDGTAAEFWREAFDSWMAQRKARAR